MFCLACGSKLRDDARFCSTCGAAAPIQTSARQEDQIQRAQQPPTQEPPTQQPPTQQPPTQDPPMQDPPMQQPSAHETPVQGDQSVLQQDACAQEYTPPLVSAPIASMPASEEKDQNVFSNATWKHAETEGAQTASQRQPHPYPQPLPHPYHRLGGWLAFAAYAPLVAVGLIALLFLISFFALFSYLRYLGAWHVFILLISFAGYFATCFFCVKFSSMIRKRNPKFLRFYELTMITLSSLAVAVLILTGFNNAVESIQSILTGVLGFFIWTTYFRKSVRVRTYMGSDAYLRCSIFFKNTMAPAPADVGAGLSTPGYTQDTVRYAHNDAAFENVRYPSSSPGQPMYAPPRSSSDSNTAKTVGSILILILIAIIYTFVIFLIADEAPEDQARSILGREATQEQIQQFISEADLDEPLIVRYTNALTGDFGKSLRSGQPINEMISQRLPTTIILILASLVVTFVFAIPMGVISAMNHNRFVDVIFSVISVLCKSIPFFWIALMLLKWFSLDLGWLPAAGRGSWRHYVMPILVLGFSYYGFAAQAIRASAIKARSKEKSGLFLPESKVNKGHAFQNAILPTIAKSGMQLGWLFVGIIIVEQIFALPGVCRMFIEGISMRDTPVALGGFMTLSLCFIVTSAVIGLIFTGVISLLRSKSGK